MIVLIIIIGGSGISQRQLLIEYLQYAHIDYTEENSVIVYNSISSNTQQNYDCIHINYQEVKLYFYFDENYLYDVDNLTLSKLSDNTINFTANYIKIFLQLIRQLRYLFGNINILFNPIGKLIFDIPNSIEIDVDQQITVKFDDIQTIYNNIPQVCNYLNQKCNQLGIHLPIQ